MASACAQARRLARDGVGLPIAVNVAPQQFREPGFVATVALLEEARVDAAQVELEITERTVMDDVATGSEVLSALRRLGVRIVLDDFGTGYSSLSYLTRLPIDVLKIDRSFVQSPGSCSRTEAVTAAIISLARGLGIEVVAEGVETETQLAFLNQHGPVRLQGFLLAGPMPEADLAGWLTERPPHARPFPQ